MTTPSQSNPYLPKQRNFNIDDPKELQVTLDKMYIEVASRMNDRTIGTYAPDKPVVTGDKYYTKGQPIQSQRQLYQFTSTANIPHNIPNYSQIQYFVKGYGDYTDNTNWYGLVWGSTVAIAGQISFYVTNTNIIFVTGGGAPTVKTGVVVLEWTTSK